MAPNGNNRQYQNTLINKDVQKPKTLKLDIAAIKFSKMQNTRKPTVMSSNGQDAYQRHPRRQHSSSVPFVHKSTKELNRKSTKSKPPLLDSGTPRRLSREYLRKPIYRTTSSQELHDIIINPLFRKKVDQILTDWSQPSTRHACFAKKKLSSLKKENIVQKSCKQKLVNKTPNITASSQRKDTAVKKTIERIPTPIISKKKNTEQSTRNHSIQKVSQINTIPLTASDTKTLKPPTTRNNEHHYKRAKLPIRKPAIDMKDSNAQSFETPPVTSSQSDEQVTEKEMINSTAQVIKTISDDCDDNLMEDNAEVDEEMDKIVSSLENIQLPRVITSLEPHQKEFISFALNLEKTRSHGGCLFDEMGLGKTLSTISFFVNKCREFLIANPNTRDIANLRMLVLCPKNAVLEWISQVGLHIEGVHVRKFGPDHRQPIARESPLIPEIFIITYDQLLSDYKANLGDMIPQISKKRKQTAKKKINNSTRTTGDSNRSTNLKYHVWEAKDSNNRTIPSVQNVEQNLASLEIMDVPSHRFNPELDSKLSLVSVYNNRWGMIAADEAHVFRNIKSLRWAAVKELARLSSSKWVITGTPVNNGIADLITPLLWIGSKLPSIEKRGYELDDDKSGTSRTWTKKKPQADDNILFQEIKSELSIVAIRRRTKNIPRSYEFDLSAPFINLKEFELYQRTIGKLDILVSNKDTEASRRQALRQSALETLLRLRQICTHSKPVYELESSEPDRDYDHPEHNWATTRGTKMLLLEKYFREKVTSTDKVLVFSNFLDVLNQCGVKLSELGIRYVRLDGGNSVEEREAAKTAYLTDDQIQVFLISTRAGNTALNLQNTTRILFCDKSMNPQCDYQAEGRALRIGQKNEVIITYLKVLGTVESRIQIRCDAKTLLADCLLDENRSLSDALEGFKAIKKSLLAEANENEGKTDLDYLRQTLEEYRAMLRGQNDGWRTKSKSNAIQMDNLQVGDILSPLEAAYRNYAQSHHTFYKGKEYPYYDQEFMFFETQKEYQKIGSLLRKRKLGELDSCDNTSPTNNDEPQSKKSKPNSDRIAISTEDWEKELDDTFSLRHEDDSWITYGSLKNMIYTNSSIPDGTLLYSCEINDADNGAKNMLHRGMISLRQRFMMGLMSRQEYYLSPLEALSCAMAEFITLNNSQRSQYALDLARLNHELREMEQQMTQSGTNLMQCNGGTPSLKSIMEDKIRLVSEEMEKFKRNVTASRIVLKIHRATQEILLHKKGGKSPLDRKEFSSLSNLFDISSIEKHSEVRIIRLGTISYWSPTYASILQKFTLEDHSRTRVLDLWNLSMKPPLLYADSNMDMEDVTFCLLYEIGRINENRRIMLPNGERFYHFISERYEPGEARKGGDYYHITVNYAQPLQIPIVPDKILQEEGLVDYQPKAFVRLKLIYNGPSQKPLDIKYLCDKLSLKLGCKFGHVSLVTAATISICNIDKLHSSGITFERIG